MAYELNKAFLGGRPTGDPTVRYTTGDKRTMIARYTLAVDRRIGRTGEGSNADYIPCVVFGASAEYARKYIKKGTPLLVTGRIQTGSYTNKEGEKVFTTEVVVENQTSEKEGNLSMNIVLLEGRPTRDPEVRYTAGDSPTAIARYTLGVSRGYFSKDKDASDFIQCSTFGRPAEFVEKYLRKGTAVAVRGRLQTGSYTNKDGAKVFTTEVVVEDHTFATKKKADRPEGEKQDKTGSAAHAEPAAAGNVPAATASEVPTSQAAGAATGGILDGFEALPKEDQEDPFDKLPFN